MWGTERFVGGFELRVIRACLNDDWNNPVERGKAVNAGQEYKCRQ